MTIPAARLALLSLMALAACGVQVNTQAVYTAPVAQADAERAELAVRTSRELTPAQIKEANKLAGAEALAALVNAYRERNGLPPVPLSPLLTRVAEAHVRDMAAQPRGGLSVLDTTDPKTGQDCSPHSWSDGSKVEGANWTAFCDTADGRYALAMYSKPRDVTEGAYPGMGFEISAFNTGDISAAQAIKSWQKSPGHRTVILEQEAWDGSNWQAMGVALGGHYAYVWFGKEPDPGSAE